MFLIKDDLEKLTGLKQKTAITNWIKNNPETLETLGLKWSGGVNAAGLPIVQKIDNPSTNKKKKIRC